MMNKSLVGAEGTSDIGVANDFRRIGLVRDPTNFGTSTVATATTRRQIYATIFSSVSGTFTADEEINQATTGAVGKVVEYDSTNKIVGVVNDTQRMFTNEIAGVGMVMNKPKINKYSVYENGNYNRYSFVGNCRIDRTEMTEHENMIMRVFDILCFTGNRHMKRGQGLTMFPVDMLYKCHKKLDLVDYIRNMFKRNKMNMMQK